MTISITIRKNCFEEYEVPTELTAAGKPAAIYYTDDRLDAIDTARFAFGGQGTVKLTFRSGTYSVEEA